MWKPKRNILILILFFLLFDLGHSGYKYFQQPLYGDIVPLVLPDNINAPILADPFGFKALATEVYHPNINRFFCAFSLYHYMKNAPLLFQKIVNPVQSLYCSTSFLKIMLHLSLLLLLTIIAAPWQSKKSDRLLLAFIITPFLVIGTYLRPVGMIEGSIVYAMYYSLPFTILLIFLQPFFRMIKKQESDLQLKKWEWLGMIGLIILLSFSSAIMSPVVLIGGGLFLLFRYLKLNGNPIARLKAMPRNSFLIVGSFILLSAYSFYLGLFNSESTLKPTLAVRYASLGQGITKLFFGNLAVQLLWLTIALNYFLLGREKIKVWGRSFKQLLFPLLLFALCYIILLPLGGYRIYRPDILRADMMIPITLSGFFLFSTSTYYLLVQLKGKKKNFYLAFFLTLGFVFSFYDYKETAQDKACEEKALYTLSTASTSPVRITENCKIIDWTYSKNPDYYRNHVKLLQHWNVVKQDLLFYVQEK